MRKSPLPLWTLLLAVPSLLQAAYKPWYAYLNATVGAKALSMGNAFTAVADDASSAFWNPAGLARPEILEFQLSYRASRQSHIADTQEASRPGSSGVPDSFDSEFSSRVNGFDFFALSVPVRFWGLQWGFAIAYDRAFPYGFQGSQADTSRIVRNDREIVTTVIRDFAGTEGIDTLAVSAAFRSGNGFAFGVTVQQYFNSGTIRHTAPQGSLRASQETTEKMEGRRVILGALFTPVEPVTLGVVYHTTADVALPSSRRTWVTDSAGTVSGEETATCRALVHLPAMFSLGLQVKPAPALTLAADLSKVYWAHATITGYHDQGASAWPFPVRGDFPFAQSNVANLRLGAEWNLSLNGHVLHARGGWFAERQLFRDVRGEAVTARGYSLGAGVELSAGLRMEVVFQVQRAVWPESAHFDAGDVVPTRFRNDIFNLALVYRFRSLFRGGE